LVSDKATKRGFDPSLGLPDRIFAAAYANGVIFRCFSDAVLGFAPALTYTEAEFDVLFKRLRRTLDQVLEAPEGRAGLVGSTIRPLLAAGRSPWKRSSWTGSICASLRSCKRTVA